MNDEIASFIQMLIDEGVPEDEAIKEAESQWSFGWED
jgi:hypothetical protein